MAIISFCSQVFGGSQTAGSNGLPEGLGLCRGVPYGLSMHAANSTVGATSVELVTQDYAVAVWRNVLVVDWRERTTGEGARDVQFRLQRLARAYPEGIFYLAFVA